VSALVALGARLVRAGGRLRLWSVVGGCAVAVAVLATAWSLPDAFYPVTDPTAVDPRRGPFVSLSQALAVPVLALVLTVGRLSSQVRDRRLASLRLLGVPHRHVAVVALVENLLPAGTGALLGIGGYLALRAGTTLVLGAQLQAPIGLAPARLALVVLAVVVVSLLVALAPLRRLGGGARAGHAVSAVRPPSRWRLVPLVPAGVAFALLLSVEPGTTDPVAAPVLLGGVLSGALGVALVAPLLSYSVAGRLARSQRLAPALAGRGIQTQSVSIGRRVVALGLAVYVVLGGAGMVGVLEGRTHVRAAIQQIEAGPQAIHLTGLDLSPALEADVEQVAGVRAVVPQYSVGPAGCGAGEPAPACTLTVFVGTCDGLSARMVVTGCRDDSPAWIESDLTGYDVVAVERPASLELVGEGGRALGAVDLVSTITQDVPATARSWVWPGDADVFVPVALAVERGLEPTSALVVADAGAVVRAQVNDVAVRYGAQAHNPYLSDYQEVVATRTVAWTLMGVGIGVALLAYGLATVDRAREQRRPRARLVALGVPATLLRQVGAVQGLLPLVTTILLAAALGAVTTAALSHYADQDFAIAPRVAVGLIGATTVGALLVTLATVPLTRGSVRAEDLRQE